MATTQTTSLTQQLFEQLFRRYERKYVAIAFNYVRDADVARDVVNDSFLAVWEHREELEFVNVEAYIYRVVRNNCLMYRRKEQRGKAVYEKIKRQECGVMDYYTRTIESCDPNELFRSEVMEIFREQLEQMPELTRRIFTAHRFEGKSYKEIAERYGIPLKRVDKELQHAAARLRLSLKDYLSISIALMALFEK